MGFCPHEMKYTDMVEDKVYRVTKPNTDGGILKDDLIFIDSRDGSLCLVSDGGGWYNKDEELLDPKVVDFECVLDNDYRVLAQGKSKMVLTRKKLEELLKSSVE